MDVRTRKPAGHRLWLSPASLSDLGDPLKPPPQGQGPLWTRRGPSHSSSSTLALKPPKQSEVTTIWEALGKAAGARGRRPQARVGQSGDTIPQCASGRLTQAAAASGEPRLLGAPPKTMARPHAAKGLRPRPPCPERPAGSKPQVTPCTPGTLAPHSDCSLSPDGPVYSCPALSPGRPAATSGRPRAPGHCLGSGASFPRSPCGQAAPPPTGPAAWSGTASHRVCGRSPECSPGCTTGPAAAQGQGPTPSLVLGVRRPGTGRSREVPGAGQQEWPGREGRRAGVRRAGAGSPVTPHTFPRGKRSPRRRGPSDAAGLPATRPLRAIVSGGCGKVAVHSLTPAAALPRAPRAGVARDHRAAPTLHAGAEPRPPPRPQGARGPRPECHISDNHGQQVGLLSLLGFLQENSHIHLISTWTGAHWTLDVRPSCVSSPPPPH